MRNEHKTKEKRGKASVYQTSSYVARCAQLAMLLEVSAHPKPGNIDRDHDYKGTTFEHFLTSSVAVYPILEEAAGKEHGIGGYVHKAVLESAAWQKGGNTHFGAFLLLFPLAIAAGRLIRNCDELTPETLTEEAFNIVKETDVEDAVQVYMSFGPAGVKVRKVDEFDLFDAKAIEDIRENCTTLFQLMEISSSYDLIAREWTSCFTRCAQCARIITREMNVNGTLIHAGNSRINHVIVYAFLMMLASDIDTFIETKFDRLTAEEVSARAGRIIYKLEDSGNIMENILPEVFKFDEELLTRGINPGSTADIMIAGLFISLLGGMRF
jgi:triphosphoribosyl-dephospho-CoA synthase